MPAQADLETNPSRTELLMTLQTNQDNRLDAQTIYFSDPPPVAKPCEPPAGIARLAGALQAGGVDCRVYDASLDGMLNLGRASRVPTTPGPAGP
jgi:hypothetical protein